MSSKRRNQQNNPATVQADNHVAQARMQMAATMIHQGPLPTPESLQQYEMACPGAADRIIRMAEAQAAHRQRLEDRALSSRSRDSLCGIVCGFLLGAITVGCGTYAIVQGYTYPGAFLGSAGLVGLVGVFIYGTRESRKERERKMANF